VHVHWTGALQRDLPPKSGVRLYSRLGLLQGVAVRVGLCSMDGGRGVAFLSHTQSSHTVLTVEYSTLELSSRGKALNSATAHSIHPSTLRRKAQRSTLPTFSPSSST
jgi:hypothetical protein